MIYLAIIYSSAGTSKTQHASRLISMHFSLTKFHYVNLFRKNCSLYSDAAFRECSLSKWRDRGCTLHRQRELPSFWACQQYPCDQKKVTFLQQTMRKKKDEREGDKWKGGRHSVSLNVVIEAGFRALSDNRIRLQRRVRCLQFRPPPSLRTTYRGSLQLL